MTTRKQKLIPVVFSDFTEFNGVEYQPGSEASVTPEQKVLFEKHGFIKGEDNESTNEK